MCSSATAAYIWTILQISQVAGHFTIIPPNNPVIGFLGKDVILPCQVAAASIPESTSIRVHWTFSILSEKIDVKSYYGGKKEEMQDRRYQYRTELFYTELNRGNMSLKLKNSQLFDQGKYSCTIILGNWPEEVDVELKLMGLESPAELTTIPETGRAPQALQASTWGSRGAEPTITLEFYQGWGISLTCSSQGWYPKPPVLWLNSEGENRTEMAESSNTEQEPGGAFSVSSSITIEPGGDNGVSCKIINNGLQMQSESRVLISDVFYPTTDPWLPPLIIIILIVLCIIAFVTYKLRESHQNVFQAVEKTHDIKNEHDHLIQLMVIQKQTSQGGSFEDHEQHLAQNIRELEFRRAQSHAAPFTLDPDYKHPGLIINEDQKRIQLQPYTPTNPVTPSGLLMVLGKEGYETGKYYWEVRVGSRLDWELGVLTQSARDRVRKENFVGPLGEGCWALRSSREGFITYQDGGKVEKKEFPYQKIGIFLDLVHEEHASRTITFYNAEVMFLIHSITIQSNEKLYPFLSFVHAAENADQSPLEVIHVRVPIPLNREKEKGNISSWLGMTNPKEVQYRVSHTDTLAASDDPTKRKGKHISFPSIPFLHNKKKSESN